jgi:uncharacterized BrkB/YihY/UPF0761 family membrane protein
MSGNKDKPADHNEKLFSRSRLFFIIFSALLIVFVVYYFPEIRKEIRMLKKVNIYWLIAAIVSQFLTYFFTAVIYRFLLAAHKIKQLPGYGIFLKPLLFHCSLVKPCQAPASVAILLFLISCQKVR